jgi:uncharacterized membrane protein
MSTPTGPTEPPEERRPSTSGPPAEPPEAVPPGEPDESSAVPPPPPEERPGAVPPPPPPEGPGAVPPAPPPPEQPTGYPPPPPPESPGAVPPSPEQPTGYPPPPPPGGYPSAEPPGAYPPPPPVDYGGVATAPFTTGEAISYGWQGFTKNLGPVIVLGLVVIVIQVALGYMGSLFETPVGQILFSIVSTIVSFILTLGVIRAALAVVDGRRPEVGMLFRGEGLVNYIIASLLVWLAFVVGFVLCIIPGLIVAFLFQFYGYATVDETHRAGPIDALSISARVARDNIGPVLLFDLAAIGLLILGALLCGVGLLVAYPVVIIATAYVWRRLVRGQVAQIV